MRRKIILILLIVFNLVLFYYLWYGTIVMINDENSWLYIRFEIPPLKDFIK